MVWFHNISIYCFIFVPYVCLSHSREIPKVNNWSIFNILLRYLSLFTLVSMAAKRKNSSIWTFTLITQKHLQWFIWLDMFLLMLLHSDFMFETEVNIFSIELLELNFLGKSNIYAFKKSKNNFNIFKLLQYYTLVWLPMYVPFRIRMKCCANATYEYSSENFSKFREIISRYILFYNVLLKPLNHRKGNSENVSG